jgi:tripartite-type tricarboxylate transporter receptor subunit TctC
MGNYLFKIALLVLSISCHGQQAMGQGSDPSALMTYPSKAIHLIVPFPPGGGNDFIARFIAQKLSNGFKQSVVVDNKAGAGGLLGTDIAIKSPADGYTLLLISASYTVNSALYALKYDPANDMTPIGQVSQGAFVLVAHPSLSANSVSELINLSKVSSSPISIASSGHGSVLHLSAELLMSKAGIKLLHVPYKGGGPALADTLSGQTQLFFSTPSIALPFIKSGKLKALGVTTLKRAPVLSDIPTLQETGLNGYEVNVWHGLIAPKNLNVSIVQKINQELVKAFNTKEAIELLEKDGVYPSVGTPQQFEQLIKREITVWKDLIKNSNINVEP